MKKIKMPPCVIMAGGLGTRLRPLTEVIPKPLLPLGDCSILEIILHNLRRSGVTTAYLAINYMSDYFEDYFQRNPVEFMDVKMSKETEKLGTAGPLKILEDELDEPFLVLNGDILTNLDFSQFFEFFDQNPYEIVVGTKKVQLPTNYGVIDTLGNQVISIVEKPVIETEVVAGIYCLSPSVIRSIPSGVAFDMPLLLQESCKRGLLGKYLIEDYWLDIGHMENYKQACKDITENQIFHSIRESASNSNRAKAS